MGGQPHPDVPLRRAPDDLATVAAHDLREPLETVSGFLTLLARRHGSELDAEGRELLEHALASTARMRTMLQDLLEAARGGARAPEGDVDLAVLAHEVVDALGAQLERTGGRVDLGELPCVRGDAPTLRRALQNLISNALDATSDGGPPHVEVAGRRARGDGGADGWAIDVRDHGVGVAPEHRERIFDAFTRLRSERRADGTGLGLAMTRAIATAHGGTVDVTDAPDGGAKFTLWLPASTD